jgi:hypothetical protein
VLDVLSVPDDIVLPVDLSDHEERVLRDLDLGAVRSLFRVRVRVGAGGDWLLFAGSVEISGKC